MLPAPSRILGALWDYRDDAVRHALPTIIETVVGFLLAVVLAIGGGRGRWTGRRSSGAPSSRCS